MTGSSRENKCRGSNRSFSELGCSGGKTSVTRLNQIYVVTGRRQQLSVITVWAEIPQREARCSELSGPLVLGVVFITVLRFWPQICQRGLVCRNPRQVWESLNKVDFAARGISTPASSARSCLRTLSDKVHRHGFSSRKVALDGHESAAQFTLLMAIYRDQRQNRSCDPASSIWHAASTVGESVTLDSLGRRCHRPK